MIGNLIKRLFGVKESINYKALLANGAVIVDVRTQGEFKMGHIKGAVNIPVDEIKSKVNELKQKGKPVITCCRSGARSGMAASILRKNGLEAYNGGPWNSLNNQLH
jgi:rhodanese-related sulfurtransferase